MNCFSRPLSLVDWNVIPVVGLLATQLIASGESQFAHFEEGRIIISWCQLEADADFLYDWSAVLRTRNLYRRLANAIVESRPYGFGFRLRLGYVTLRPFEALIGRGSPTHRVFLRREYIACLGLK